MILMVWMGVCLALFFPTALSAQFAFYDSLNGIHWAQIEPPSVEHFESCQILREGLGYVRGSTGTIYEFDTSRPQPWRRLPRPDPYLITRFFALAADDIWASVEVPEDYKQGLFHWNGEKWSPVSSPNVYNIRDFLFSSPEKGWFACQYGELWRYFRGQWQQEKLPVFIHVNNLTRTADGALYAVCEAPEQVAVLKRWQGKWQILASDFTIDPATIALSPSKFLLFGHIEFSPQRINLSGQPVWMLPLKDMQFFDNGSGYGLSDRTIYALHDTVYLPLAHLPAASLTDLSLYNQRFSWIVGKNGFMLAPQSRSVPPHPQADRVFGFNEYHLSRLYGMAILQDRPGKLFRLYLIQTAGPNFLYGWQDLRNEKLFSDQARRLNIAGTEKYKDRYNANKKTLTNYDQAIATGDLNGDGLDDIVITSMYGHPFVYFNSGHDYYFDATAYSGLKSWGSVKQRPMLANLFDADHDGDLDLFIACQYQSNAFFINNGRGQFSEVGQAAGLSSEGGAIGGYVADFNGDGWEDLYVTRVNRPNILYHNLGPDSLAGIPRFEDVSAKSGDACWPSLKQSQGAAIADYDNDGDFDLFVCNLLGSNRLLQNNSKGYFTNVTSHAGLTCHDQSVGATFFDADHDGDLDLLVANKGVDRFYKNSGDGRFVEHSEYLGSGGFGSDLIMHRNRQFGGNSSGTLVFDLDDDADLDALISNYDAGLFVFQNGTNDPQSAIQIFPEGIVSNRSAVGAKVFLYESGKMNNLAGLVGLRLIESANSYGCSPVKVAHFGVDPTKEYDAKIVFPSGIVREVSRLRGGVRCIVPELKGLAASAIKAQRTLANMLTGYRSREGFGVVLGGAFLLAIMLLAGRKFFGLSAYDQIVLAAVLVSVFLACFILWFAGEQFTFVARPLGLSTGLSILAIFLIRSRRLRQARPASLEMLQVRLNAFGHGTLIHHYMNRLEFYAENLDAAADLPVIGRERLLDIVRGLLRSLNNEIPPILHYQYVNIFAMDLARRLETTWTKLKKALTRLRRNLQRGEKLEEANLPEIATLQHQLREQIRAIKKRFSVQHYTDIKTVTSEFVRQSDHAGVRVLPALDLPRVHITAADLTFVLAELASNALHHTDGHPPQIDINLRHSFDELCIDVQDNGSGIPESLWEEISRAGYTTKKEGKGGFGLYHVRQRIEKYGGKIFVAASEVGKGTTMRICLKTEI